MLWYLVNCFKCNNIYLPTSVTFEESWPTAQSVTARIVLLSSDLPPWCWSNTDEMLWWQTKINKKHIHIHTKELIWIGKVLENFAIAHLVSWRDIRNISLSCRSYLVCLLAKGVPFVSHRGQTDCFPKKVIPPNMIARTYFQRFYLLLSS